jgi:hypothetical protein
MENWLQNIRIEKKIYLSIKETKLKFFYILEAMTKI